MYVYTNVFSQISLNGKKHDNLLAIIHYFGSVENLLQRLCWHASISWLNNCRIFCLYLPIPNKWSFYKAKNLQVIYFHKTNFSTSVLVSSNQEYNSEWYILKYVQRS